MSDFASLRMRSMIFMASGTGRPVQASNLLNKVSSCSLLKSCARSPSMSYTLFFTASKVSTCRRHRQHQCAGSSDTSVIVRHGLIQCPRSLPITAGREAVT